MKPSSADPAPDRGSGGLSPLPAVRPGVVSPDTGVRPARLDRQLGRGAIEPGFADEHLEAMVRQAASEAREAARTAGYAAGWAEGRQAASEQAKKDAQAAAERMREAMQGEWDRVKHLLADLGDAIHAGRRAALPAWEDVADTLADGAIAIAQAAIARELRSIDAPVLEAVRGALQSVSEPGQAIVHLHPQDAATLGTDVPEGVRIVPDRDVQPGSVVVLTPAQRLAVDLPAALAAAERVLRS